MISVCIITKNEAEHLEHCLKQLEKYPLELIVVDTGSTDDTIQIATRYTDHIYSFQWCDDFSKARNYAISKAKGPWILTIDTDEYVEAFDYKRTVELLEKHSGEVGRICRINLLDSKGDLNREKEWINRLFKKDGYTYKGSIHEQITAVDYSDYKTFQVPITVEHTGYLGTIEMIEKKASRNIQLLLSELEELNSNGKSDPYILYQLGKGYYLKKDYTIALDYFEQATCFDLNPQLEYVLDMIIAYGYTLLSLKMYEQALNFEGIYTEFSYSADFIFIMGLIYMNNAMFDKAIKEFEKATQKQDCLVEGVNSYKAYHNIGVIYDCLGNKKEAAMYYNKCKNN